MKVGFVCQPFDNAGPPDPGGSIGLITWEVARRLSRSHQVVVCAPRSAGQNAQARCEGVQFRRVRLGPDRWLLDRPRRFHGPVSDRRDIHSVLYYPIYAACAAKRLYLEGCDIIHIHNFSQFIPIARVLNRRAKIVLHMNCDWLAQFDRNVINRRLRYADAIIGCADYITDRVKTHFPSYADRCATVYNGVDVAEFSGQSGQPSNERNGKRFIFVGRVSPEKGIHILLDAFKTVVAREPEAELTVVGGAYIPPASFIVQQSNDPMVRDLRRFYTSDYMEDRRNQARATVGDRVSFVGPVTHRELITYLRAADVFMQPSVWGEPFPLSVVEAMAAGLPVIASRVGGLPEAVIEGKTGLLMEPNNAVALAEAMLRLGANKKMAHSMGAAGAARARDLFSWEAVVARLNSLYRALNSGSPISGALPISIEQVSNIAAD